MKLHRLCDVSPNPAAGLICRQSKWNSLIGTILFSVCLLVMPAYSWWSGEHRLFGWLLGAFAALVIPLMVGSTRRTFRSTNWLAWICADGFWLNLRSFQDDSSTDAVSVVQLNYADIVSVSQYVETYDIPGTDKRETVRQRMESLDIRLKPGETADLDAAIKDNRQRKQPETTSLGFIKSTHGLSTLPVSLPEPDLIRVVWRGGSGYAASPSLRRVLAELAPFIKVDVATRHDAVDYRKLDDTEFNQQVLRMVETGDRIGAINLLKSRRGMTTTQAHEFVEELGRQI